MSEQLNNLIVKLAEARQRKQNIIDQIDMDPYVSSLMAEKAAASTDVSALEAMVKFTTLEEYRATGDKKPHEACGVRMVTKIKYDYSEAREWAEKNLPEAIVLDTGLFEKFAKEQKTRPLEFVTIKQEPSATIKTDLAQYAPVEATEETPF